MMTSTFAVIADIRYLDGPLAGIEIPAGYRVAYGTREAAGRCVAWLERTRRDRDFVRAAVTGHRYEVIGKIRLSE